MVNRTGPCGGRAGATPVDRPTTPKAETTSNRTSCRVKGEVAVRWIVAKATTVMDRKVRLSACRIAPEESLRPKACTCGWPRTSAHTTNQMTAKVLALIDRKSDV